MGKPAWVERAHRARGVSSPSKPETVDTEPAETAPTPEIESDTGPDRATCPDCGREIAVNKDGSLRKHNCVEIEEE